MPPISNRILHVVNYTWNRKKDRSWEVSCMSSKIFREIRQPLVAHQSAKFDFWGQYLMFGPPSHVLASFPVVYLIFVFVKIALYFVVNTLWAWHIFFAPGQTAHQRCVQNQPPALAFSRFWSASADMGNFQNSGHSDTRPDLKLTYRENYGKLWKSLFRGGRGRLIASEKHESLSTSAYSVLKNSVENK